MPEFDYNKYSLPQRMGVMGQPGAPRDPNLVEQNAFLNKLSGERVRAEAEKENRLEQADNFLTSWNSGKLKEKELFTNLKKLQSGAVGETEKKKFEVIFGQTQEKVMTRNLENKERELQSSYLQGKLGINDVYKQYSGLARVAAMANLTELSTTLMLRADLYLKQMKDEIKGIKAEPGDSFLEKFFALDDEEGLDLTRTGATPTSLPLITPSVQGPQLPSGELPKVSVKESPVSQPNIIVKKLPPQPSVKVISK